MNPAILQALIVFAGEAMPTIVDDLTKLVAAFKQQHPALGQAPPSDVEAEIDREAAAEIQKLEATAPDTKPTGTP